MPVLVKLTPNITDIRYPARAARAANADGVALINTISSLIGVNLDTWAPDPDVRGKGSHGGYAGPAVKPIALNMVGAVAGDPDVGLPDLGHRRHRDLARRGGLPARRRHHRPGGHQRHALRLPADRRPGRRAVDLPAAEGPPQPDRARGQGAADAHRLGQPGPGVPAPRPDRPGRSASTATCATRPATTAPTRRSSSRAATALASRVEDDYCVGCRLCQYVCPVEGCITFEELEGAASMH